MCILFHHFKQRRGSFLLYISIYIRSNLCTSCALACVDCSMKGASNIVLQFQCKCSYTSVPVLPADITCPLSRTNFPDINNFLVNDGDVEVHL